MSRGAAEKHPKGSKSPRTRATGSTDRGHHPSSSTACPQIGFYEWFSSGEYERVERILADLKTLGIAHLRTAVSWADWCAPGGEQWYAWLLPRLAEQVEVLPYFVSTPPSLGMAPKTSAPPRDPKWYADFIDQMITLFGDCFEWVELWSGPNNLREWDVALDPEWWSFSRMVGGAAYWVEHRGKKTVLGSTGPVDPHWVRLMCERKVMQYIDAVGMHGLPGPFESGWEGWGPSVARVREVLDRYRFQCRNLDHRNRLLHLAAYRAPATIGVRPGH